MRILIQVVVAVFAAIGGITLLHGLFCGLTGWLLHSKAQAELRLYGDGCSAQAEQLIRLALHLRKQYLPELTILFQETGQGDGPNIARRLAMRENFTYLDF